ncbi:MAG: tetratricopeptide repeat protein [Pseudonocardiales bacterium]|nr:tetratricopeptide repeat protein [Pseudonocardiales bacterium]
MSAHNHDSGGRINNLAAEPTATEFVGREDALAEIRTVLEDSTSDSRVLSIRGLMGVGKSRLAKEYGRRHEARYKIVWWAPAEQIITAKQSLVRLGAEFGLPATENLDLTCDAVLAHLELVGDYLLIFDNVEDMLGIRTCMPRAVGGHVLLTTRIGVKELLPNVRSLTVRPLRPDSAAQLLDPKSIWPPADVARLCEELGFLPHALVPAQRALARGAPPTYFLRQLQHQPNKMSLTKLGRQEPAETVEPRFYSSIALALETLARSQPEAVDLLRLCAFLGPGKFRSELFRYASEDADLLPRMINDLAVTEKKFAEAVDAAVSVGLVEATDGVFELHRLTQHYIRISLSPDHREHWDTIATQVMLTAFPTISMGAATWPRSAANLEHAIAVGECRLSGTEATVDKAILLNNCGQYLFARGQYHSSAAAFRRAAAILRLRTGLSSRYATAVSNLGLSLLNEGHHKVAHRRLEQALSLRRNLLPPGHPDIAASHNNLGCAARESGDLAIADRYFTRAQELYALLRKVIPGGYAMATNNLGVVRAQLRSADAVQILEQALVAEKQVPEDRQLEIAISMNNLALAYQASGRHAQSEQILRKALTAIQQATSEDHPYLAGILNNLGLALRAQGKREDALSAFQSALRIERNFYGPIHAEVAGTLNNIGVTYRHLRRYVSALRAHEDAHAMLEKIYGQRSHRRVAAAHGSLGNMLRRLGDLDGAVYHHRKALEMERDLYPEGDLELAGTHDNLGRALRHAGQLESAVQHFRNALTIKRKCLPPISAEVVKSLNNLGVTLRYLGQHEEAYTIHEEAVRICRGVPLQDDRLFHYSLVSFAFACRCTGRLAEASSAMEEAAASEEAW